MSSLQIPTVTPDDLLAFQSKHFPLDPRPAPVHYGTAETAENDVEDYAYKIEEDDGLGYYPDGVKRTLTDEQIQIFRHSEIHALLREKQRKQEEEERKASASSSNRSTPLPSSQPEQSDVATSGSAQQKSSGDGTSGTLEPTTGMKRKEPPMDEKAPAPPRAKGVYAGRRIITYDDD
ncbi:hypothetical protein VTN49DRAFT_6035 [Thermomyces lanuginosus]|uniref:uncharacterized protein n=1 Tax=Thermomyces lanuginosus TaxID=5541 RepID=UPI0037426CBC